jgi:hypothetical protein
MLANGIQFIATHGQLLLKSVALLCVGALGLGFADEHGASLVGLPGIQNPS